MLSRFSEPHTWDNITTKRSKNWNKPYTNQSSLRGIVENKTSFLGSLSLMEWSTKITFKSAFKKRHKNTSSVATQPIYATVSLSFASCVITKRSQCGHEACVPPRYAFLLCIGQFYLHFFMFLTSCVLRLRLDLD